MSDLQQAVARAIADAWDGCYEPNSRADEAAAAEAIRLVLAEAQQAVEALRTKEVAMAEDGRARHGLSSIRDTKARALGEALAALAALDAGDAA